MFRTEPIRWIPLYAINAHLTNLLPTCYATSGQVNSIHKRHIYLREKGGGGGGGGDEILFFIFSHMLGLILSFFIPEKTLEHCVSLINLKHLSFVLALRLRLTSTSTIFWSLSSPKTPFLLFYHTKLPTLWIYFSLNPSTFLTPQSCCLFYLLILASESFQITLSKMFSRLPYICLFFYIRFDHTGWIHLPKIYLNNWYSFFLLVFYNLNKFLTMTFHYLS